MEEGETTNFSDGLEAKSILEKQENQLANKKIKTDFRLRRRYFLREFTHRFLKLNIYTKFDDFFAIPTISSFENEKLFNEQIVILLESLTSNKKHEELGLSLLDLELAKDIVALEEQEDFTPVYITQEENKKFSRQELKNKIVSALVGEYVTGEALRYVILHLQEHNLDAKKLKSLLNEVYTSKNNATYHGRFAIEIHHLLSRVMDTNLSSIHFMVELNDKQKVEVLKDTISNFNQADKVTLNENILLDFDISDKNFSDEFNGDEIQGILDSLYERAIQEEDYTDEDTPSKQVYQGIDNFLDDDILMMNFQLHIEKDFAFQYTIPKCASKTIEEATLFHFTKGVLEGIALLVITNILLRSTNKRRDRVLKKITKYASNSKPSYQQPLKVLHNLADFNKHKKIMFIVCIAHELCLSKSTAYKLSKELGMNSYSTFHKHFDEFYEIFFPNHKYLSRYSNRDNQEEDLIVGTSF